MQLRNQTNIVISVYIFVTELAYNMLSVKPVMRDFGVVGSWPSTVLCASAAFARSAITVNDWKPHVASGDLYG